jgi:hypothetical protein
MPLALLLAGLGTWVLVGVAGLSMIYRYLLLPSIIVMLFAAVCLTGWTMLGERGAARRVWALTAALLVAYGAIFTATRLDVSAFATELRYRGESHASLQAVLEHPAVQAGRRCGPVSLPNHKLVPEVRWLLDAGPYDVVARSDPRQRQRVRQGGVLVHALAGETFRRYGHSPDPFANALPLPHFRRVAATEHFAAYVRC